MDRVRTLTIMLDPERYASLSRAAERIAVDRERLAAELLAHALDASSLGDSELTQVLGTKP